MDGGGQRQANGASQRLPHRHRLPSVDQALQYSPFNSILPFSADIIPMPNSDLPGFPTAFNSSAERDAAQRQLDTLNWEMTHNGDQAGIAARAENELRNMLEPEQLTDFKFKSPYSVHKPSSKKHSSANGQAETPKRGLSQFGKTVFDNVHLDHRLPTPVSPGGPRSQVNGAARNPKLSNRHSQVTAGASPTPKVVIPARAPMPQVQATYAQSHQVRYGATPPQDGMPRPGPPAPTTDSNAITPAKDLIPQPAITSASLHQSSVRHIATAVQIPAPASVPYVNGAHFPSPQTPTPQLAKAGPAQQLPVPGSVMKPMVIIPPSTAETLQSDYVTRAVSSPDRASRKRKRGFGNEIGLHAPATRDQRTEADLLLRQFQETLEDVFEADNQSSSDSKHMVSVHFDNQDVNTIAPSIHVKLEPLLHKLTTFGKISDIPLEDLQRLQSLCSGALSSVENEEYSLDPNDGRFDAEEWAQRWDHLEIGLRAARTVLRTMCGGREEKGLYSEDLLLSVLKVMQKAAESCIIPIVEARSSAASFEALSSNRKPIAQVLHNANKALSLLAKLLANEEMAETLITPIEFFAIKLMFVENASNDKESILGTQRYETLRRDAMDIIAIIFSHYSQQRTFLIDEILTSLQKLPTTRQAARQFRLKDGRCIQLVTALIIQLVQASSTPARGTRKRHPTIKGKDVNGDPQTSDESSSEVDGSADEDSSDNSGPANSKASKAISSLQRKALPLCNAAGSSAQQIVHYLVQRAQTSSKSGDEPHRQLLDIFVEDLLTVLSLPEWPGAEILIRAVCAKAIGILENSKLAPAKNMALELLGMMGSSISDLVASTRDACSAQEHQGSEFSGYLIQMFEEYTDGSLDIGELLNWGGPFNAVAEYLERNSVGDLQTMSAQAYYVAQWAKTLCVTGQKASSENDKLAARLETMLSGTEWIACESLDSISAAQCKIAYSLTILKMDFCRRFDYILRLLIDSVTSEQTTVRSRGLKSVTQMLEKDPTILDRAKNVKNVILNCATDSSPMVRDAALSLIGKCINLRPNLEDEFLPHILRLSNDTAIGVRKRSMKLLKDSFLRNASSDVKAAISDSLLQRATDHDTAVAELALQTFGEIWITPFAPLVSVCKTDVSAAIALRNHFLLTVKTSSRRKTLPAVFVSLLRSSLSASSKAASASQSVCKALVKSGLEVVIESGQSTEAAAFPTQSAVLDTLTIFAQADSSLFDSTQLRILQPYIENLADVNDLNVFRPVVIIFRCVLPALSSVEQALLEAIQKTLLKNVSKLFKSELNEVAQCLWAIQKTLNNPGPLVSLMISVVNALKQFAPVNFGNQQGSKDNIAKLRKYMNIAGLFGKHCDFEEYVGAFRGKIAGFKGNSVARLIVQSLLPFVAAHQPQVLRASAVDCIGLVCQSKPSEFQEPSVEKAFTNILKNGESELQGIILSTFRDFFTVVEQNSAVKSEDATSNSTNGETMTNLGKSMKADKRDEASSLISQYYLKHILPISVASADPSALSATEVIASINRQGAAFPKDSIPTLVALGTSKNSEIAAVASDEHKRQHALHETMFEGEYMKGLQESFSYQVRVYNDPSGYNPSPYTAKLGGLWDAVKTSKAKFQKKFISNYCSRMDFEPEKIDLSTSPSPTLQFSRFLCENAALFDYTRVEELLHVITCMEKVVANTGSGVAHTISTEVFHVVVEDVKPNGNTLNEQPRTDPVVISDVQQEKNIPTFSQSSLGGESAVPISLARLTHLTTAATILSIIWDTRTFLRRLYGQTTNGQKREGRGRPSTKDLSKAPTKAQNVPAEKFVAAIAEKISALGNEEAMNKVCKDFVEVMSVDNEIKVSAEDEESFGDRPDTPGLDEDDEGRDTPMSGASRGTKRKGSLSASNTPTKKRGRPSLGRKRSSKKSLNEEDDDDDTWK